MKLLAALFLALLAPTEMRATASTPAERVEPASTVQDTTSPPVPEAARFELPPGAAADAVARLVVGTPPARNTVDLGAEGRVPAVAVGAWNQAATWNFWAESIAAESIAAESIAAESIAAGSSGAESSGAESHATTNDGSKAPADPASPTKAPQGSSPQAPPESAAQIAAEAAARRARLALLALEHGRSDDAWEHLAATTPEWTAALLPRFLPGVPPGTRAGTGGACGRLDAGVALSPALPPPSSARVPGRVDRRAMSVRDVSFATPEGTAVVSMRVAVEAEGVQIDVRHRSGPAVRFAIRIPKSPDYEFGDEYVDWYRQDVKGAPHVIEVKPGEEEHTIYGRFDTRVDTTQARVPDRLPPALARGGLWLVVAEDDPDHELMVAVAAAIGRTGLGFACGLRPPGAPTSGIAGTTVDLTDRAARPRKLAGLVSAIEHFALARHTPR